MDACMGAIMWWAFGYAIAYGDVDPTSYIENNQSIPNNAFMGTRNWFLRGTEGEPATFFGNWLFQWAFAATAATIVSGAVAERCQFVAYLAYTAFITIVVYPIGVHWTWSVAGFLSPFAPSPIIANGYLDFAGALSLQ